MWTFAGLTVAIGGFGLIATIVASNIYFLSLLNESLESYELDKLVSSIKAGKKMKAFPVAVSEIRLLLTSEINGAINNSKEMHRLEVDTDKVNQLIFSPNGQLVASLSEEKIAKVWSVENGKLLTSIEEKKSAEITSISFSADSKMLVYASDDQKIKFWTMNGIQPKTLSANGKVSNISVSLDNKLIATSIGKEVILWDLSEGKMIRILKGHTGMITSMSFSPDGKTIASADQDDQVKLWNLSNGEVIKDINNYGTIGIRFTSNGKMVVLTSNRESKYYTLDGMLIKSTEADFGKTTAISPNGTLNAQIDGRSVRIKTEGKFSDYFQSSYLYKNYRDSEDKFSYLRFSPDGKVLASTIGDRKISLWRADKSIEFNKDGKINNIQFSPDGQIIASSRSDNAVDLLNKQGMLQQTIEGNGTVFSFSPDGKEILTQSSDKIIKLIKPDGRETNYLGDSNQIFKVSATSPDSKTIVLFESDGSILFMNNGQMTKTNIKRFEKGFMDFSPNSKFVFICEANLIHLWQTNNEYIGKLPGHTSEIKTAIFSPDSELIATTGDDNLVKLYSKSGKLINILRGHSDEISSIKFSPDSKVLVSTSQSREGRRKSINLWSRDGILITSISENFTDVLNDGSIQYFYFSPDSKTISTIDDENNTVKIWNLKGERIAVLAHNDKVKSLNFSPDNKLIVSSSTDQTVRLWRSDGMLIQTLRGSSTSVDKVAFNPVNGQTIVSKSSDGMVQLWKRNGTKLKVLQQASDDKKTIQTDVKFSEDGKNIVIENSFLLDDGKWRYIIQTWNTDGKKIKEIQRRNRFEPRTDSKSIGWIEQDKSFKIWNLDGSLRTTFSGHQDTVNSISFSPDGTLLASGGDDNTVRLWDRDGKLLKTLNHTDKVNSVGFSADGKLLASGSDDRTVKLWTREGQLIKQLSHSDRVSIVKFNHTDNTLASTGDDKIVKVWTQTGELKSTLKNIEKVSSIAFTLDGKTLVSNYKDDEKAKLWQISDGKQIIKPTENYSVYESPGNIKPAIPYGFQFEGISRSFKKSWRNLTISPDQTTFATAGDRVSVVDFDMDRLLIKACSLARNYLKNNPKVKEDDRKLCDDIPIQK